MPRIALALLSIVLAAAAPARGSTPMTVVFVVPGPGGSTGALRSADIDGTGSTTLIERGVSRADAGGSGAYAIVEGGREPPRLVAVPLGGDGAPTDVAGPGFVADVAASAKGDLALLRFVDADTTIPQHLEAALDELARPIFPVLVPGDRPGGTTGTVVQGDRRSYDLLFTNDPERERSHAEQINVSVRGTRAPSAPLPDATPVRVRGTEGFFGCGASACFLEWEELGATYSVGEFGDPDEAVSFAESLEPIDQLLGPGWRGGEVIPYQVPELAVRDPSGEETIFDSVEGFCECGFSPKDWDDDARRLLVILGAEGFTTLHEYDGPGDGEELLDGRDGPILDAAYGPDGRVLALVASDWGRAGRIRTLDGEIILRGVRAFDVEDGLLAYVSGRGAVIVRDLAGGAETTVAEEGIDVALAGTRQAPSPGPTSTPAAPARQERADLPWALLAAVGGGAFLLGAGAWALVRARRR